MKISACVGFGKDAATTRQIMYMREHAGENFRIYTFEAGKIKGMVNLFRKLMKDDSDVFLIVKASPYTGIPATIAGILKRKKRVVLLDDYEKAITTERHGKLFGNIMGFLERIIIKMSNGVIAASEFMYEKAGNKKKKLIPFGIPTQRFKKAKNIRKELGLKKTDKVIVYVGSLTKNADLDIAIDSMPFILRKNKNAKLLVVGGGESIEDFKMRAVDRGIIDNVIFTGKIGFEKVPDYIISSDVCLIPMKDMDIDKGRCPMKLLEYIASGKPIVGGRVGMVKYFLSEKFLCEPGDPESMAKTVNKVLSSARIKNKWKMESAELKKKYSLKEMWKLDEEFLQEFA